MEKIEVFVNWNGTVNSFVPQFMNFSAGEVHLASPISIKRKENVTEVFIVSNIQSSEDILRTLTVTNAIRNTGINSISLVIPYLPYSRSDRVCSPGEEFGLEMFAQIINSQGYKKVVTFDAHSEVASSHINRLKVIGMHDLLSHYLRINHKKYDLLVSPDKGALLKVDTCSRATGINYISGFKVRDPATGKLSGFGVSDGFLLEGKKVLVLDDLADGGGTFIGLLKEMQVFKPKSVDLLVTHGIFSKGIQMLEDSGFRSVDAINYFNLQGITNDHTLSNFINDIVRGDFYYE